MGKVISINRRKKVVLLEEARRLRKLHQEKIKNNVFSLNMMRALKKVKNEEDFKEQFNYEGKEEK